MRTKAEKTAARRRQRAAVAFDAQEIRAFAARRVHEAKEEIQAAGAGQSGAFLQSLIDQAVQNIHAEIDPLISASIQTIREARRAVRLESRCKAAAIRAGHPYTSMFCLGVLPGEERRVACLAQGGNRAKTYYTPPTAYRSRDVRDVAVAWIFCLINTTTRRAIRQARETMA